MKRTHAPTETSWDAARGCKRQMADGRDAKARLFFFPAIFGGSPAGAPRPCAAFSRASLSRPFLPPGGEHAPLHTARTTWSLEPKHRHGDVASGAPTSVPLSFSLSLFLSLVCLPALAFLLLPSLSIWPIRNRDLANIRIFLRVELYAGSLQPGIFCLCATARREGGRKEKKRWPPQFDAFCVFCFIILVCVFLCPLPLFILRYGIFSFPGELPSPADAGLLVSFLRNIFMRLVGRRERERMKSQKDVPNSSVSEENGMLCWTMLSAPKPIICSQGAVFSDLINSSTGSISHRNVSNICTGT